MSRLLPEILDVRHVAGSEDGGGEQVVLALHIAPEIAYFENHFPGFEILPGVVQIDWAVRFARQYLALGGAFSVLENIKFLSPVLPGTRLDMSLKILAAKEGAETRRLEFAFADSQRRYSSGRIVFDGRA